MFKSNIRVLLAQKEATQNDMHEATGLTKKRIKELKDCSMVRITNNDIEQLCKYFGKNLSEIITHVK